MPDMPVMAALLAAPTGSCSVQPLLLDFSSWVFAGKSRAGEEVGEEIKLRGCLILEQQINTSSIVTLTPMQSYRKPWFILHWGKAQPPHGPGSRGNQRAS